MGVTYAGDLVSLSAETIVVRFGDADHSFKITERTQFTVPKEELRPGTPVKIWAPLSDQDTAYFVQKGYLQFLVPGITP